jgi:hypothetical protein
MAVAVQPTKFAWRGNTRKNLREGIKRLEALRAYNADHPDRLPPLFSAPEAVLVQNMSLLLQQKLTIRINR